MVQLIPTLLEYLLNVAAQQYAVTVKMLRCFCSYQCNYAQPATPAAPTASATLQPTCRSNWNDNCDCPSGTESLIALMVLIPTLLEYLLMWLLQLILLRLKMLQVVFLLTKNLLMQPDKTRSITVDPVCNTDRT
jgi:hypothetical protein